MTRRRPLVLLASIALLAPFWAGCSDTSEPSSPGGSGGKTSSATGGAGGSAGTSTGPGGSTGTGGSATAGAAGSSLGTEMDATVVGPDSAVVTVDGGSGGGVCQSGNCTSVVGEFDGYMFVYPCTTTAAGCMACPADKKLTITREFKVNGDPTKVYQVDFNVKGIVESKNYTGGVRRSTMPLDPSPTGGDLWYEGGTFAESTYSTYELHVLPKVAGAPNDYYLNARDGTDEHDGTSWGANYSASVKVNGGGTITFRTYDSNCSAISNTRSRTFDLSDTVPPPPASVTQPVKNALGANVQWLHFDVTSVKAL